MRFTKAEERLIRHLYVYFVSLKDHDEIMPSLPSSQCASCCAEEAFVNDAAANVGRRA